MVAIDVHTHMLTKPYLDFLRVEGEGTFEFKQSAAGQPTIFREGIPFFTLMEEMFDYDARIRDMDRAGVDVAIVSLTCPNAFFGPEAVSGRAARMVNDSMAEQHRFRPDRIQWFASLPWQYPPAARAELEYCIANGAVGVFVTANIDNVKLTDPRFAPIWQHIDDLKLPVLVHPTTPPGMHEMELNEYGLIPPVGFMFDTTLAIARMILDGFFDRFPNVKIIAAHGGGTLPYIAGRLDRAHEMLPACSTIIKERPSTYLQNIYYDSTVYSQGALELCVSVGGEDNVMYGSDYPHNLGDMTGCLSRVRALPGDQAKKVSGTNARRIFNL